MPKFEICGHYEGACPCLYCREINRTCDGCLATAGDGYAVDTDKLCETARMYCESGRDEMEDADA